MNNRSTRSPNNRLNMGGVKGTGPSPRTEDRAGRAQGIKEHRPSEAPLSGHVFVLLGVITASGVTTFMYMPILAVHLSSLGYDGVVVGASLGLLGATGLLSSIAIGWFIRVWGPRTIAITGVILRCLGLVLFNSLDHGMTPLLPAILVGLGGSCLSLGLKTHVMQLAPSRQLLALRSTATNIGALIGPGVGAALYTLSDFSTILLAGAGSHVAMLGILIVTKFPPARETQGKKAPHDIPRRSVPAGAYLAVCPLVFLYWAMYSHWSLLMPLTATDAFDTPVAASVAFTGNALIILALQYVVLVNALSRTPVLSMLLVGVGAMLVSYLALSLLPQVPAFLCFVVFFTVGEMLINPSLDELSLKLVGNGSALGSFLGVTGTVAGLGTLIGSSVTGWLVETSHTPRSGGFLGVILSAAAIVVVTISWKKNVGVTNVPAGIH